MRKAKLTERKVARDATDTPLQCDLNLLLQLPHTFYTFLNTDQMSNFLKTHPVLSCLCTSHIYPPWWPFFHPTVSAWTALTSPSKSRLNVIFPVKPANLPGSVCSASSVFHQHCGQSLFSTGDIRYLLLQAVRPSIAGSIINLSLDSVSNVGPGIVTYQSMVAGLAKLFLLYNFPQSATLCSDSIIYL